jgi:Na+-transporting methylmalonyl-CoA/oxaloacetate decarboxylase gamma subunit
MKINVEAFLDSLVYMGIGMLGIFLIISLLVVLLNVFSKLFPAGAEDE